MKKLTIKDLATVAPDNQNHLAAIKGVGNKATNKMDLATKALKKAVQREEVIAKKYNIAANHTKDCRAEYDKLLADFRKKYHAYYEQSIDDEVHKLFNESNDKVKYKGQTLMTTEGVASALGVSVEDIEANMHKMKEGVDFLTVNEDMNPSGTIN